MLELVKSVFDDIAETHLIVALLHLDHELFHLVVKNGVLELHFLVALSILAHLVFLVCELSKEHLHLRKMQDGGVGCSVLEVGIIQVVTTESQGNTRSIGTILVQEVFHGDKVAQGFGHFLTIHLYVAVTEVASRKHFGILEDGLMVKQGHGQVVLDQVLA